MITTYTNIPIDPELIIGDVEKHVTGHNVTTPRRTMLLLVL